MSPSRTILVLALTLFAPVALAHPGHSASGLLAGITHPLTGLDHLLAMLALGAWAAQLGGRALWAVPSAFLAAMAVGSMLGIAATGLPAVELGISGSVLALGLLVLFAARLPLAVGMALSAGFALFHGYAHGAEMSAGSPALAYGLGFLLATALLHLAGLGTGRLARAGAGVGLLRAAGASVAVAGAALVAGAV